MDGGDTIVAALGGVKQVELPALQIRDVDSDAGGEKSVDSSNIQ